MGVKFRRIACVCLTAVMGTSLATSQALALAGGKGSPTETVQSASFENVTGKMDLSSIVLKNLSPSVLENAGLSASQVSKDADYTVIVEFEGDSVLDITGDAQSVSEYISSYAGKRTLNGIRSSQQSYLKALSAAGIKYTLRRSYTTVTNGIAITVHYSDLQKLASFDGVKSVVLSSSYKYPEAVTTQSAAVADNPSNVYETGIYKSQEIIDKYDVDGSGVAVAILDTGLDYTHTAFTSHLPTDVRYTKNDIAEILDAKKGGVSDPQTKGVTAGTGSGSVTADDVYINAKVPFAYDYADGDTDVYPSYSNHGTHVAGIVAGNADSYTDKDGNPVKNGDEDVPFKGVAYNAQLVICKVFTDNFDSEDLGGAVTEDVLAALDDCVNLGVDVINMSLGSSAGFSSIVIKNDAKGLNDTEGEMINKIYGKIKDAGISLICAASNDFSSGYGSAFGTNLASSPDSGTVGSPSTFDGAMSVGSINGQLARYMTVTDAEGTDRPVYYLESSDENSVPYDFLNQMLAAGETSKTFKYVIINARGEAADYTDLITRELKDKSDGPVIAVISRGKTTFKEKIQLAEEMGADAVIMANNVAGSIRMSLGDLKDPVPAVSVTLDSGNILKRAANSSGVGYITVNRDFQAGPFMNDYSSWGVTSDLKLKPDITAHGGEITSTVPGGYDEQSGTSMASPNFAGFVALLRSYLLKQNPELGESKEGTVKLNNLINQIAMSSATMVYDQDILPYSPRKQGAGLATLSNAFSTKAYLSTIEGKDNGAESGRPKVELGEDKDKNGEYTVTFYANNFGTRELKFELDYRFMTETLSPDGLSVAEKAHLFTDSEHSISWEVDGAAKETGSEITVPVGEGYKITAKLTLTDAGKKYLDDTFVNGMFVEGFIILKSLDGDGEDRQCDLSLPFLGFYGDWSAAPMLDYDCYEIAEFEQDTSLKEEERPQAQVWATQAYASYSNNQMSVPLGGYVYLQDEDADKMYTDPEHAAISCYDYYYGAGDANNYLTSYKIRALYAGLLRNAEVVQYVVYDDITGEVVKSDFVYRISKAYANGGSAVPANVKIELDPVELGLVNNGKYRIDFSFFFRADDVGEEDKINDDNTFSMIFYVDYEAPVLEDVRVRYYDYKDGNKDKQRIYLDLDIYDNHYSQDVILCYMGDDQKLTLATEFITPVYDANKNGTTTVSIEITDLYDKYKDQLYVQLDDYALNHSIYRLLLSSRFSSELPDTFEFADGNEITIGVNENYKLKLDYEGSANISDFTWRSSNTRVLVKNGEIFGASAGTADITVGNGKGTYKTIKVTVTEKNITLPLPNISFGLIVTADQGIRNAQGSVNVDAGKTYKLEVICDPWYYPVSKLNINWRSRNPAVATVAEKGDGVGTGSATITTLNEEGVTSITATLLDEDGHETLFASSVMFNVQDPFTVTNFALTEYNGAGGTVKIPDDENILYIGEEAFKDNTDIEYVIIPSTVVEIRERAFQGCTNLKGVYFIDDKTPDDPAEIAKINPASKLSRILANAFDGCTSLKTVDFTNVKVITLAQSVFLGCSSLENVKKMTAIGTMNRFAFYGCSSLKEADLTSLHTAKEYVFAGCTSLQTVKIGKDTAIGSHMFEGCTSLQSVEINASKISEYAFNGCSALRTVTFGSENITVGDRAFAGTRVNSVTLPDGEVNLGDQVFGTNNVNIIVGNGRTKDSYGAVYEGDKLLIAPSIITADFRIKDGTASIAPYAFASSRLSGTSSLEVPESVTELGEGAFAHLLITGISLPANITAIPDYAFYACTSLKEVTLPAETLSIGVSAFEGCTGLDNLIFNEKLIEIESYAFSVCQALTSVTLPDSVKHMGNGVFAGCHSLEEANLPALETLGAATFGLRILSDETGAVCSSLETVTFAEGAKTIGAYTFFPGTVQYDGSIIHYDSKLTSVTIPDSVKEIGEGAFYFCNSLRTINLNKATVVGGYAFSNCTALTTVTGLDKATYIGGYAFENCTRINSVNLENAVYIGDSAFDMPNGGASLTNIRISKAEHIGDYAFFGGSEGTVTLPSTLKTLGFAAFSGSPNLTSVSISGSDNFFSENGVLYRNLTNEITGKKYTELCVYPAAKSGESYEVPEGTVSVQAYAFAHLSGSLKSVTLPYSLKVIGAGAFYNSGIESYTFTSYEAPVLATEDRENYTASYSDSGLMDSSMVALARTLYYTNFEEEFIKYSIVADGELRETSSLKMTYPVNGVGYDNFIYDGYFPTKATGAEVMNNDTFEFKTAMDDLLAEYGDGIVDTVKSWEKSDFPVNKENKELVESFSEAVKDAHRLYNNIKAETQLALLDAGKESGYYYNLLTSIEEALKPVKAKFGIIVKVSSLALSPESSYKSEYFVGDAFDKTGLVIIVTYDDYSTEIIGADDVTVVSDYAESLSELDTYVTVEYGGAQLRLDITVTEKDGSGCNTTSIILGCVGGVVGLLVVAGAVVLIIFMRKKKAKKDGGAPDDEIATDASLSEPEEKEEASEASQTEEKEEEAKAAEEVKEEAPEAPAEVKEEAPETPAEVKEEAPEAPAEVKEEAPEKPEAEKTAAKPKKPAAKKKKTTENTQKVKEEKDEKKDENQN